MKNYKVIFTDGQNVIEGTAQADIFGLQVDKGHRHYTFFKGGMLIADFNADYVIAIYEV